MAGAATNPDPDIFQYAAAQVKMCIDVGMRMYIHVCQEAPRE